MIRSMTGYASAALESPRGRLCLELRSANTRFLDIQFRISDELRLAEPLLRELIAARVARGKVDCRLAFIAGSAPAAPERLNAEALERLKALAAEARRLFPEAAPLRVADILRWPGVLAEEALDDTALRTAVERLCQRALEELNAARAREGAKLAETIVERLANMRQRLEEVAPLVPQSLAAYQARLAERLREALGSADDERIRVEGAVFAAKIDVAEELERLRTHVGEVERTLARGGAVGKRLDFPGQEINREANSLD